MNFDIVIFFWFVAGFAIGYLVGRVMEWAEHQ